MPNHKIHARSICKTRAEAEVNGSAVQHAYHTFVTDKEKEEAVVGNESVGVVGQEAEDAGVCGLEGQGGAERAGS